MRLADYDLFIHTFVDMWFVPCSIILFDWVPMFILIAKNGVDEFNNRKKKDEGEQDESI